jgi:hypothetical protein
MATDKKHFVCLAFALSFLSTGAGPYEWRLYAASTLGTVELRDFFLRSDIKHLPNGNVEVWTKGLAITDLRKIPSNKVIEEAANKLRLGYRPAVADIEHLSNDDVLDAILMEEIANEESVGPRTQTLEEINCKDQAINTQSIIINNNGKSGTENRPTGWEHFPPNSPGANLLALVCK